MKLSKKIMLLAGLAAFLAFVTGCQDEGPMEKAGEEIDQAVEKAGENIEEGGEEIQDAAEDASK